MLGNPSRDPVYKIATRIDESAASSVSDIIS
jgi:hypothetical protein